MKSVKNVMLITLVTCAVSTFASANTLRCLLTNPAHGPGSIEAKIESPTALTLVSYQLGNLGSKPNLGKVLEMTTAKPDRMFFAVAGSGMVWETLWIHAASFDEIQVGKTFKATLLSADVDNQPGAKLPLNCLISAR